MSKCNENNNSILFNILTLVSFGVGLFLIMFLKRNKSKDIEQHSKQVVYDIHSVQKTDNKQESLEDLNDRQIRILERIKQERRMDPNEIYSLVPNVSTRTVRRDMDILVKKKIVCQEGSTKATTYSYIGE